MRRWLLAVAICGVAACGSENTTAESNELAPPPTAFDGALVSDASAKAAHGKRLTDVLGCTGCHGKTLQGNVWVESPEAGVLHASNLTLALPNYTDAQLRRLLLTGEHPRREHLWDMPSELFQHLAEPDIDG
jgi:cytochrome c553